MNKPIKFRLYTLTPVHIGCDDVYEPTSFKIDVNKKKLVAFNLIDFVKSLSEKDRQELVKICDEGSLASIIRLYNFIAKHPINGREIDIAQGLMPHHQSVCNLSDKDKKLQNELNNFTIFRTTYNSHNDQPYISGSSLKGAIRTAYLSKLANDKNIRGWKGKDTEGKDTARKLEGELLGGSFETDPFRMVKVSDFLPVKNVTTKVVYVVNRKKKPSERMARGPYQILEIIKEGTAFEGLLNIETPLANSDIKEPINQKALLESLNKFYYKQWQDDEKHLKSIKVNTDRMFFAGIISKLKDTFGKSVFLVRIGRHSGAESVTIEGNRDIKINQGKNNLPKSAEESTTIWLASETFNPKNNEGLVPFGWVLLEIATGNESIIAPLLL